MKGFLNRVAGGAAKDSDKGESKASGAEGNNKTGEAQGQGAGGRSGRRKSSFARKNKVPVVKDVPLLQETPMLKREALFRQKLQICNVIFDFEDPDLDIKGKEQKRETLVELAEYINSPVGQKILTESMMPDIVETVRINLFRALPPQVSI